MAYVVGTLVGSKDFGLNFFNSAAVVAGQLLVREATATNLGEAANPAGTGSGGLTDTIDILGVAADAATSVASATVDIRWLAQENLTQANIVRVLCNPFQIMRFRIAGGATVGTALAPSTATPANVLSNDTADTTAPFGLITDTAVGTVSMVGGIVKGHTGNNVGAVRKLTAHTNSVSTTAGIGFINSIAVGDTFIRVPYSRMTAGMQMTTDFTEANGVIAVGALGAFRTLNVVIDEQNVVAWVDVIASDAWYNPESA